MIREFYICRDNNTLTADEAAASCWRGVGLEPPRMERMARSSPAGIRRTTWRSRGQVGEGVDAGHEISPPLLVEPRLGAAQDREVLRDGAAGDAESNGARRRRELVVHRCLRDADGGCPRSSR
jgi:hypothetical protein